MIHHEKEFKFILDPMKVERFLLDNGPFHVRRIQQHYLFVEDDRYVRVREVHIPGEKRTYAHETKIAQPDHNSIELSHAIDARTYQSLSRFARCSINKFRYKVPLPLSFNDYKVPLPLSFNDRIHRTSQYELEIDAFQAPGGIYLWMGEIEVSAWATDPPELEDTIADFVRFSVPQGDTRFNNPNLSDKAKVEALLRDVGRGIIR